MDTVTGDHGWRPVDTAIWLSRRQLHCLKRSGERTAFDLPGRIRTYGREGRPAVLCDGGTIRIWTEDREEGRIAQWLNESFDGYLTGVAFGHALQSFLTRFESTHANWGQVVGFAKENVALCKPHWLEHENGEVCVPATEHGSHSERDFAVPMWTRNVAASQAMHTEFGKQLAALLQGPNQ